MWGYTTDPDGEDPRQLESNGTDVTFRGVLIDWFMRPKSAKVADLERDMEPPPTLDPLRQRAWFPDRS